jgi:hypothetical protein
MRKLDFRGCANWGLNVLHAKMHNVFKEFVVLLECVVTRFKTLLRCSHRTPTTALATRAFECISQTGGVGKHPCALTDRTALAETQMARWSLRLAFPLLRKAHQ